VVNDILLRTNRLEQFKFKAETIVSQILYISQLKCELINSSFFESQTHFPKYQMVKKINC
jgi:hypothetical protein